MPLTSVPSQAAAGPIDAFYRDNPGNGTLGTPDYSPVPYVYAALLGPQGGDARWVIDQHRQGAYAAFKGSPDGLGALRNTGDNRGSFAVEFACLALGTPLTNPGQTRAPQYTWGPGDFALAVRHPGTVSWSASSIRAYIAFNAQNKTIGMRITTASAVGPWDTEIADSSPLAVAPDVWDGFAHTAYVATFGSNVVCILDGKRCYTFRSPRAYKRLANGTTDTSTFGSLPTSGNYGGYDNRNERNYLYGWTALQPASGDLFYYDQGVTAVQPPSAASHTPTLLPSGESWMVTGTATIDKDGLLLAASSTATFIVQAPHGLICTRWAACQAQAGLVFRRQDASNYFIVTSTGVTRYTAGVPSILATFTAPLADGDEVVLHNAPTSYRLLVNGTQTASLTGLTQGSTAAELGFSSPSSGPSRWRYIVHQPYPNDPILPTA
ncbi:hypothetical protein [Streptomyces sp. NPDC054838]